MSQGKQSPSHCASPGAWFGMDESPCDTAPQSKQAGSSGDDNIQSGALFFTLYDSDCESDGEPENALPPGSNAPSAHAEAFCMFDSDDEDCLEASSLNASMQIDGDDTFFACRGDDDEEIRTATIGETEASAERHDTKEASQDQRVPASPFPHDAKADKVKSTFNRLQGLASARMLGRQLGALHGPSRASRVASSASSKNTSTTHSTFGSGAASAANSTLPSPRSGDTGATVELKENENGHEHESEVTSSFSDIGRTLDSSTKALPAPSLRSDEDVNPPWAHCASVPPTAINSTEAIPCAIGESEAPWAHCVTSSQQSESSTVQSPLVNAAVGSAAASEPRHENKDAQDSRGQHATSTRAGKEEKSRQRRAGPVSGAKLLRQQLNAVKADVQVDQAVSAAVAPDSVSEHVHNVMQDLSARQRRDVQRHIDTVMRAAAERMGWRSMEQKQDLCERANAAIVEALDRKSNGYDFECAWEDVPQVDSEWDMALRAKIRLATHEAWKRNSKTVEDRISNAANAAWERRQVQAMAFNEIEGRILRAAQEACWIRGKSDFSAIPEHASQDAWWQGETSQFCAMPVCGRRSCKNPRVHIPDGKLDACIKRIVADAKSRKVQRDIASRSEAAHLQLNDTELNSYIAKIALEAKSRVQGPCHRASQATGHQLTTRWKTDIKVDVWETPWDSKEEPERVRSPKKWGGC